MAPWGRLGLALVAAGPSARGLWNDCLLEDIIDASAVPGMGDFWNTFVRNESKLAVDTGAEMNSGRFFMRWAAILTRTDEMLAAVAKNCLFGFLTVLLHAIPSVDYEQGRTEAVDMLGMAQALLAQASQMEGFATVRDEARSLGWDVESIDDTLWSYGSMLSETGGRQESCTSEDPKIYVYPPLAESDHEARERESMAKLLRGGPETYLGALLRAPLQCLFGMYGTELLYHRFFSSWGCRVTDPEAADLFFVPSYFKCIEVINFADRFNANRPGEDEAGLLFQQTASYVQRAGPWFDRHDGADHMFLFSWGRFPCRLPNWRGITRSAIALQVEDCCEDLNHEEPQHTFSRWKDIIIPGHIDRWRALDLKRQNLPIAQRDVILSFHGRHAGNTESYANVTVRTRILALEGLPGVSVGGFVEGYHELLGQSIFCLAPRGITPWTIHLYVAMLAGCIPVILSDAFELPFQDILPWSSFSIRWPEQEVGSELYTYLVTRPRSLLEEMKKQVDAHSCWFDYYSGRPDCSPYVAVLKTLRRRHLERPAFAGRAWRP